MFTGFVISFDDEAPVKPKPVLKPRQSSVTKLEKEFQPFSRESSYGFSQESSPASTKDSSLISVKTSSPSSTKESSQDCDNNKSSPSQCLVCLKRQVDNSAPGGKVCNLCSKMLIKINCDENQESYKGNSTALQ